MRSPPRRRGPSSPSTRCWGPSCGARRTTHHMAIGVRIVNKTFGKTPVLRDLSLDVASGSLTALLGPSGGGKSTLLRVIAGLEQPDTGTVVISGVDATRLAPQRRNVGFVFQHYAAFKHMTVFGNVAFGLQVRKRPKDEIRRRVGELLELVHLEQFANRYHARRRISSLGRLRTCSPKATLPNTVMCWPTAW